MTTSAELKLTNVRLSFPELFEATQVQGQGPKKYRAVFLVPEDSPLKKQVDSVIREIAREKWGERWKSKFDANLAAILGDPKGCCWQDGARKEYQGYEGQWALSTGRDESKGRPLVIDANRAPLTPQDGKPYAGCYVNAKVQLWVQENQHGKGIRCELQGVQFVRHGDAFTAGGRATVEDFEDVDEGADAADLV